MTIAISSKINDGIVLATDSASTIMAQDEFGNVGVINVYYNANKLFNICRGLPIGIITWGAGNIGAQSTSTLIKDFRERITSDCERKIDKDNYRIEDVCNQFKRFIFDEQYTIQYGEWPNKPDVGFIISGYSSNEDMAEEWLINIDNGVCTGPIKIREKQETGLTWNGQPEAITRLYKGFSSMLPDVLSSSGLVDVKNIPKLIEYIDSNCTIPLSNPVMSIQDNIELAEFLVDLTEKYSKYAPGPQTVGGPIEIAAITKHEGFKWIRRKHYYSRDINI